MFVTSGIRKFTILGQASYASGGAVAEQAIAGVRTVHTFSLQKRFIDLYKVEVHKAYLVGRRKGIVLGFGFGGFMFTLFGSYGLAFWYGYTLIINHVDDMTGSDVLVVFMSMMIGKSLKCRRLQCPMITNR